MSGIIKSFKTYAGQVDLLANRGMDVGNRDDAVATLGHVSYYRLSDYWYSFRKLTAAGRHDDFFPGTKLTDVVALYEFDSRLRAATFAALAPIELTVRALLGHELGKISPQAHLDPSLLGPTARRGTGYQKWLARYERELHQSREDFVEHHRKKYDGRVPVWAATELLDWGSLSYLYGFAPRSVQDLVAQKCDLSAPQFMSWLKALNLIRNTCAHHGRLFNRVHAITPKLPKSHLRSDPTLSSIDWSRTFGQLTLVQFLSAQFGTDRGNLIPTVLQSYPDVEIVPISHMGAPRDWQETAPYWGAVSH